MSRYAHGPDVLAALLPWKVALINETRADMPMGDVPCELPDDLDLPCLTHGTVMCHTAPLEAGA